MRRVSFGPWLPDLPSFGNPGLTVASGVIPKKGGYTSYPSLTSMGLGSLSNRVRGGIAALDRLGNAYNFAGDVTSLNMFSNNGFADVSKAGGYDCKDMNRWNAVQLGLNVIFCNPNDPIQFFNLQTSSLFADLSATAPKARHMGVIEDFLVVGNTNDTTDGVVTNRIWWPARGNPLNWPTPGSDAAAAVQSDNSDLEGDGGWVMAVVTGAEVGAVFQERAIHRMDYVAGDVIFQISRVEPKRGLLIPDLAIPYGREVLYCSEDGWYRFDYTTSTPVGDNVVNRTFLADIDTANLDRVSWVNDPDRPITLIGYPGAGNSGGTPNKILIYDWHLNQFATMDVTHALLTRVLGTSLSLDSLPDDDLDAISGSFDDRLSGFSAALAGGYTTAHTLSSFSGSALAATLETGDIELLPGYRSRALSARPLVVGADPTIEVATLDRNNVAIQYGGKLTLDPTGKAPMRADGRYHRFRTNIPSGGFTDAQGLDVQALKHGTR